MGDELRRRWLPTHRSGRGDSDAGLVELCAQLAGFHGYRTVWQRADGMLLHAEPEEPLDGTGYRYVGTFLRPSPETLQAALIETNQRAA